MTRPGVLSLTLALGTLALGYLVQPKPPDWSRWLVLAMCQLALGLAAPAPRGSERAALVELAIKTALWPILAAGVVGAARLARLDLYTPGRAEWLAGLSLAGAHLCGEWIARRDRPSLASPIREADQQRMPPRERWACWLVDLRWLLAILGVPWCWHLASPARLAQYLAAALLILGLARLVESIRRPAG